MHEDAMWQGFADAVVRLDLGHGPVLLQPTDPGEVGSFPFSATVHIITAHNPAGVEADATSNRMRHRALAEALQDHETMPSIGSAVDGSFAEPGFAVLDLGAGDAIAIGRRFGQRAIYRWQPDALVIVGVDENVELQLGWRLEPVE